jgi:hypothetical protein
VLALDYEDRYADAIKAAETARKMAAAARLRSKR